ncbi:hypothetical protein H696_04915 [Fonticula alba]|uniref:Thiamin pyrophosphokinase thiamin-binding domain-containing protein n=1 Tax=Fonticula alba TaxID=691883 RepID=A0A058Z2W4_FONAL|nr:hypothetical protein H696_04915 [Fonticula alba]KCV68624.1 hypothetical protein H696_04915 [Fonticula alba]|eukprot:XP_009497056.1 hypothetical protein H696_04915 [Fonticula alba]
MSLPLGLEPQVLSISRWLVASGAGGAPSGGPVPLPTSLVLVNQPVRSAELLQLLWAQVCLVVCADGAANRLFDHFSTSPEDQARFVPDIITGDLDSIRAEVRDYYATRGSHVVLMSGQDDTDLDKALVQAHMRLGSQADAIVLDCLEGRLDHTMQTMNSALLYGKGHHAGLARAMGPTGSPIPPTPLLEASQAPRCLLLGPASAAVVLEPGSYILECDADVEGPTCGLIPLSDSRPVVWSRGLAWDLDGAELSFGGLISSSNAFSPVQPTIHGDGTVTMPSSRRSACQRAVLEHDAPAKHSADGASKRIVCLRVEGASVLWTVELPQRD